MKNLTQLFRRNLLGICVITLLASVIVGYFILRPRDQVQPGLAIQDGKVYSLMGFTKTRTGQVDTYLVTFQLGDKEKDSSLPSDRGTILIPVKSTRFDKTLKVNSIVWDAPLEVEGRVYSGVRMNPRNILPTDSQPAIHEDDPIRKIVVKN